MNKLYIILALVILYSCKVQEQPVTQDPAYIKQFHTGVRAMLNEQHEEAITAFKVCLQQNPKDAALHYAMFETYLKQEKYTEGSPRWINLQTEIDEIVAQNYLHYVNR